MLGPSHIVRYYKKLVKVKFDDNYSLPSDVSRGLKYDQLG